MKTFLTFFFEVSKIILLALLVVLPIRYLLFQPFFVRGDSMVPNYQDGDYLIVDELSYKFRSPERGEVVIFRYPYDETQKYIKRIIGLPGETIEVQSGVVAIQNQQGTSVLDESNYLQSTFTKGDMRISLGENEYFVLGDNRSASSDSRSWGAVPKENIIGQAFFRAWPLNSLAKLSVPTY